MEHTALPQEVFDAFYVDHGVRDCFISFHLRGDCGNPQPCGMRVEGSNLTCDLPEGHETPVYVEAAGIIRNGTITWLYRPN